MARTYNSADMQAILKRADLEKAEESPILDILLNGASMEKYDFQKIKSSYRKVSMLFHPDKTSNEPEDLRPLYEDLFRDLYIRYHDSTDLRQELIIGTGEIPWSIEESHKKIDEKNDNWLDYFGKLTGIKGFRDDLPLSYTDRSKIELKTATDPSNYAQLELFTRDPETYDWGDFIERVSSVIKKPKEVKKYIEDKKTKWFNDDLAEMEAVLTYGFRYDTIEHDFQPINVVSVKHLHRRGAFDAPPGEWVTIDKRFVRADGYVDWHEVKALTALPEDISRNMPIDSAERNDTLYNIKNGRSGYWDMLASIEPSTMTMKTEYGHMFIACAPYHKLFLPKGNRLVLIEDYNVKGSELARTDSLQKTTRLYDPHFDDCLIQTRILPWVCLTPKSVEMMKDYAVRLLGEKNKIPEAKL